MNKYAQLANSGDPGFSYELEWSDLMSLKEEIETIIDIGHGDKSIVVVELDLYGVHLSISVEDIDDLVEAEDDEMLEEYVAYIDHMNYMASYKSMRYKHVGTFADTAAFCESIYADTMNIPKQVYHLIDWNRAWRELSMDYFRIGDNYYRN